MPQRWSALTYVALFLAWVAGWVSAFAIPVEAQSNSAGGLFIALLFVVSGLGLPALAFARWQRGELPDEVLHESIGGAGPLVIEIAAQYLGFRLPAALRTLRE